MARQGDLQRIAVARIDDGRRQWREIAGLLDQLLEESPDNCLYYSGDFDLKGLQIAAYLAARHSGRCHPWHFDEASYEVALKADGIEVRASELSMLNALPEVFKPLVTKMQEKQKWAFLEGIVDLLVEDIRAWG